MKKVVLLVLVSLLLFTIACSDDGCENQNPTVKLVNNGTGKADIQIKTSNGNTENINNIEPGTSSARNHLHRAILNLLSQFKVKQTQ